MDYFDEAFGGFHPESDKDAALKFSLCILMIDHRLDELLWLIEGKNNFGGLEGDPGWIIERREKGDIIGYEKWPENALFRSYVAPDGYFLSYPEFFADKQTFFQYIRKIIDVYKRYHPERVELLYLIEKAISATQ